MGFLGGASRAVDFGSPRGQGYVTLQRIVLDYRSGELVARVLYRSSLDAPNPGTVRRRRQVEDLAREGLRQALASLEGDAELVGTSGFTALPQKGGEG